MHHTSYTHSENAPLLRKQWSALLLDDHKAQQQYIRRRARTHDEVRHAMCDNDAQRRYTTTMLDNARRQRRLTVMSRDDKRQRITTTMTTICSKKLLL